MTDPRQARPEVRASQENARPDGAPQSCSIALPIVAEGSRHRHSKNEDESRACTRDARRGRSNNSGNDSTSSDSDSGSNTSSGSDSDGSAKRARGPMGLRRRSQRGSESDSELLQTTTKTGIVDGGAADAWSSVRQAVVSGGADINKRLPGGRTWKLIVEEKLLSAGNLRQRLLDMWTLLGVITALVASFAVDGITNSASSFQSFEDVSGNLTFCAAGICTNIKSLYKVYGALVSIGCLLSIVALGMSMLFYSYLLIQPVSKTRWFVRQNVHLFPLTFILVMVAMAMVVAGVCVQCVAAFGHGIGYSVVALGVISLVFVIWLIYHLETQTKRGLQKYGEKRRRQRNSQSVADVVSRLRTSTKPSAAKKKETP